MLENKWADVSSFPHQDYDNAETFNRIGRVLSRFGFINTSWGNDSCPSLAMLNETGNDERVKVWVDYHDSKMREFDHLSEFSVVWPETGVSVEFDKVSDVVAYLVNNGVGQ